MASNQEWALLKRFKPTENWGDPSKMNYELLLRMDRWASFLGRPVMVTCGTQGTHAENSEHYEGNAADVIVPGLHVLDQYFSAVRFGFRSIGVYPDWILSRKDKVGGLHLGNRANSYTREWLGVQVDSKQEYLALSLENLKKYSVL